MSSKLTEKHLNEVRKVQAAFISEPALIIPSIELKIDPTSITYFQDPICGKATYFSTIDISNEEKLIESILELWNHSGRSLNQEICKKISNLAMGLKSDIESQSPELSEFIYTLH